MPSDSNLNECKTERTLFNMPTGGTKRKAPRGDRLSWVQVFMVFFIYDWPTHGTVHGRFGDYSAQERVTFFPKGIDELILESEAV